MKKRKKPDASPLMSFHLLAGFEYAMRALGQSWSGHNADAVTSFNQAGAHLAKLKEQFAAEYPEDAAHFAAWINAKPMDFPPV